MRGNHDDLLVECLLRGEPYSHDFSNGTVDTICQLQPTEEIPYMAKMKFLDWKDNFDKRWFDLYDHQVPYYETGHYIFVHGWIPFIEKQGKFLYDPEWRKTEETFWKGIYRWENGMQCWKKGIREPNKTIVCGHWHCSWGWSHIRQQYKEFPDKSHEDFKYSFEPFIDEGIIALDACTAYSKKVNVLVLNEDEI